MRPAFSHLIILLRYQFVMFNVSPFALHRQRHFRHLFASFVSPVDVSIKPSSRGGHDLWAHTSLPHVTNMRWMQEPQNFMLH